MAQEQKLKVYWWQDDGYNFGDDLSRCVIEYVSGREIEYAKVADCDLLGIGSILDFAMRRNARIEAKSKQTRKKPLHIWGSGVKTPARIPVIESAVFHSVRGPITRSLTTERSHDLSLGDPGLLAADLYPAKAGKKGKIGFVPHFGQVESAFSKAFLAAHPEIALVDPRRNAEDTCLDIAAYDYIVSSSLHGLIVADSYGIPSLWVEDEAVHKGAGLKYFDYFASVGRFDPRPLRTKDITNESVIFENVSTSHFGNIDAVKTDIYSAFPETLKA